jgi:hypothetical protein
MIVYKEDTCAECSWIRITTCIDLVGTKIVCIFAVLK